MSSKHPKPWHRGSVFGTGRRVLLDREQRAVFRAKLTLQRKPGRLSSSALRLAHIMLDKLGVDGRLDPSIATLAELARVDQSTVVRCLGRLKACGFLEWTRRLVRCAAGGWRVEQASNAYVLAVPASDTHFAPPVLLKGFKAVGSGSERSSRENAARQIRALGHLVPPHWEL
jgi:hypothetical protein